MTNEIKIKLNDGIVINFLLTSLELDQNEFLGIFERIQSMIKHTQKFHQIDEVYEQLKVTKKPRHRRSLEEQKIYVRTIDEIKAGKSSLTLEEYAKQQELTMKGLFANYYSFKNRSNQK